MSLLNSIQRGKTFKPPRVVVYGQEGIGKSTFGASAPKPIFIQTEDGLDQIGCDKFPLAEVFPSVQSSLATLLREPHDYETVVIDSADWLEQLIWDQACRDACVDNIEKVGGGYGKGYTIAAKMMRGVLESLDALRNQRGMVVILIAHAKVERFEDPESAAYDRYSPRLHKHAGALVSEWCDALLFATRKIRTAKEDVGFNKTRTTAQAVGRDGGERVLKCIGGPSCVAKNRFNLPAELPLSWDAFMQAMVATDE